MLDRYPMRTISCIIYPHSEQKTAHYLEPMARKSSCIGLAAAALRSKRSNFDLGILDTTATYVWYAEFASA